MILCDWEEECWKGGESEKKGGKGEKGGRKEKKRKGSFCKFYRLFFKKEWHETKTKFQWYTICALHTLSTRAKSYPSHPHPPPSVYLLSCKSPLQPSFASRSLDFFHRPINIPSTSPSLVLYAIAAILGLRRADVLCLVGFHVGKAPVGAVEIAVGIARQNDVRDGERVICMPGVRVTDCVFFFL